MKKEETKIEKHTLNWGQPAIYIRSSEVKLNKDRETKEWYNIRLTVGHVKQTKMLEGNVS